jgi:hypothetical protein
MIAGQYFPGNRQETRSMSSANHPSAPFEIVRAPGARVSEIWHELRQRSGVVPVLLGNSESTERMLEVLELNDDTADSIREYALSLDVDAWIAERVSDEPEYFAIDSKDRPWNGADRIMPAAFEPARNHQGEPWPEVFFGLIPVEAPWLVPTKLRGGGWNDCPDAVVHTAFFRRWFERHGAVVTTFAFDIIEFTVARPPTTPEAAHELAYEQFVYCPDIVDQGCETLGNLAHGLCGSPNWFFWWD